ncbi:MAG TPA: enoyl-CoA hydratase/isomerase family protein [Verrucomicrobiae bacterium]|nr:enoyl-CoA hydratase/isomerase family protein [Verrucomicrobiae bacterium]
MTLPETPNLIAHESEGLLFLMFNRPQARNAMSRGLLEDIVNVFDAIRDDRSIRVVVLRGAGGNFCAGGDIKDMAASRQALANNKGAGPDPIAAYNRGFGVMLRKVNEAPQAVIAVCEGAVLGGGFGLACVSDLTFAHVEANFGLPETGLGLPPAQIAPFVVQRLGLPQARRLAVLGARFQGEEAKRLGLAHETFTTEAELTLLLGHTVKLIRRCAPQANADTKQIMLRVGHMPQDEILDYAAQKFSQAVQGPEGAEGTMAFIEKRLPKWAQ